MDRRVHSRVREVEEEWLIFVRADEAGGFLGIAFDDLALLLFIQQFHDFVVAEQGHDPFSGLLRFLQHIVGIRNAEVMIETLFGGQKLGLIADVPLTDALGCVAKVFQPFRDGELFGVQPLRATGEVNAGHRNANTVATGENLCPRDGTDRCGVETGELHTLLSHSIEVGCLLQGRAERTDIGVAEVVD